MVPPGGALSAGRAAVAGKREVTGGSGAAGT